MRQDMNGTDGMLLQGEAKSWRNGRKSDTTGDDTKTTKQVQCFLLLALTARFFIHLEISFFFFFSKWLNNVQMKSYVIVILNALKPNRLHWLGRVKRIEENR